MYYKLDYNFNDDRLNKKSLRKMKEETLPIYIMYFQEILKQKKKYAEWCDADFIFYEEDKEWDEFRDHYHSLFPYATPFDICQWYSKYLADGLCKKYDEVVYIDFDMIIGNMWLNCFDEWNIKNGIYIKTDFSNSLEFNFVDKISAQRDIKSYWAHKVCEELDIEHDAENMLYINTGMFGTNLEHQKKVKFIETLELTMPILNQMYINKDTFTTGMRFSNEVVYMVSYWKNKYKVQHAEKIWHENPNGNDDMNCAFLHCTNKNYIADYI